MSESATFLNSLPASAKERPLVAEVKILKTALAEDGMSRVSTVMVIKGIKGASDGSTLRVLSETHSCARDYDVREGDTYFIAGSPNRDMFTGVWRGQDYRQ